ncbi:unnamed protein product [Meloidogyne enterolobii]|uniref:Uncharacterized protein n=1 Tax=Meloidogyne enterolobii TaxID=390850 RepID=A0ACB0ZVJ7_MELEN
MAQEGLSTNIEHEMAEEGSSTAPQKKKSDHKDDEIEQLKQKCQKLIEENNQKDEKIFFLEQKLIEENVRKAGEIHFWEDKFIGETIRKDKKIFSLEQELASEKQKNKQANQ